MLKMSLLKPLCSMVLGGLQNLVFVVLEVCADAHQTKSSEGNSTRILNINVVVDHDPTWTFTTKSLFFATLCVCVACCGALRLFADSARSC